MIDALIQSAVLFALVAIVTRLLKRRAPASLRHMLWAFAILGALAAPVMARISSPRVRPLTVFAPACRSPASRRRLPTTAMPPASYISGAV